VGVGEALRRAVHRGPESVVVAVDAARRRGVAGDIEIGRGHESVLRAGDRLVDDRFIVPRLLGKRRRPRRDPAGATVGGDDDIAVGRNDEVVDDIAGQPAWALPVAKGGARPLHRADLRPEPHRAVGGRGHHGEIGHGKPLGTGEELPAVLAAARHARRRGDHEPTVRVIRHPADVARPPHQAPLIDGRKTLPRSIGDALIHSFRRGCGRGAVAAPGHLTDVCCRRDQGQILAAVAPGSRDRSCREPARDEPEGGHAVAKMDGAVISDPRAPRHEPRRKSGRQVPMLRDALHERANAARRHRLRGPRSGRYHHHCPKKNGGCHHAWPSRAS